jgi:uncharacterized membrane protein
MKKNVIRKAPSAKQIAFTALFAALCCIGTLVIAIPLPNGYFNTGDVFVLLSGWCLGPVYGTLAAAVGSALADVISGYSIYAPATLFIKGFDAFIAYMVCLFWKKCIQKEKFDVFARAFSAICGEAIMILGYFLFESILYGFLGATASLIGNLTQGICCAICAIAIISALYPIKGLKRLFPALSKK